MIDTVLNLVFRCAHRRLTRPVSALTKAGQPRGAAYVVCLDCGKQFAYVVERMQMGKPIEKSHTDSVLPPEPPRAQAHKKLKFALWASVPLALVIGSALKPKKRPPEKPREKQ